MTNSLLLFLAVLAEPQAREAPCIRIARAPTLIRGDTKVCPGRYRVADPRERGVLLVTASGIRLDLSGVILESGDSVPARYVGVGVQSRGVDSVVVTGGTIRGYRFGVRLEGGKGHQVTGMTLSGSRQQALRSTPTTYDAADWLDIFHPDTFDTYGGGLYLRNVEGAIVSGNTARDGQNGIGLFEVRRSEVADNDVSENSGWGIHLWNSSHNTIVRNRASRNVRCESAMYSKGCHSAALLLRQRSDSNVIADNDLRWSGDGLFLSGHQPGLEPSAANLVLRNDASHSYHNAFEATWSWGNVFLDNRADSSAYGFWLGYSTGATVRGNTIVGTRVAGVAIEHGSDNEIAGNVIIGGKDGIRLFGSSASGRASRGYRVDDNILARLDRGLVLEATSQVRARGNVFDGDREGLVADDVAKDAVVQGNYFLRPGSSFIRAPRLDAGGNYWGSVSPSDTQTKLAGEISVEPWKPASAGGY
jgi:parallel beta-helix repeat protein